MKKRSSERRKNASQKAREARDADLNEESDNASETAMKLDPSSIEMGNNTSTVGLVGLMQKIRKEFAMLAAMLTLQAKEHVTTLQTQLDAQAMTIQKLLDKATTLKAETAALKAENTALANAQKWSIHVFSEGSSIYTAIAKTSLNSCFSNILPVLSELTVSSTYTDTSYCIIDMFWANMTEKLKANPVTVREVIEKEIHKQQDKENWRCIAVMRNIKNHNCIWIMGRDVQETKVIKKVTEKVIVNDLRMLRD